MSKPRRTSFVAVVLDTMGWPLLWGLGICSLFYALHHYGVFASSFFNRYLATHPVQYVEMSLFCVGVAAITIKALNVIGQFSTLDDIEMSPRPSGGQKVEEVPAMLGTLGHLPNYMRNSYLARRLQQSLEYVQRKGSATGLDTELKYLSDLDAGRQQDSFGLVRVIIWATPMLGFLGTVIGITLALGDLSPQALVSEPELAMEGLLGGLSVAFDTTALALMLAMILMFGQFLTSRLEVELVEAVDVRVSEYLVGRFELAEGSDDPQVAAILKMSRSVMSGVGEMLEENQKHVLNSMEQFTERQAKIWKMSIDAASSSWAKAQAEANERFELAQSQWTASQEKWNATTDDAAARMGSEIARTVDQSVRGQLAEIRNVEDQAGERVSAHWDRLHRALTENARVLATQQSEMARQGDALLDVVHQTGELSQLQHTLNENMNSVVISGKLDETVAALSGAINLLNARLSSNQMAGQPQVRVYRGPDRKSA